MQFASRLDNVETSAIRELFKLSADPGLISFAGGVPDSALFDIEGLREASTRALADAPGAALQYGATEGYEPLRKRLAEFMNGKNAAIEPRDLIVTTGSQQALDLLGKTMISPGDKVIVEGPTFLATIQCFRLYGAEVICAPVDAEGVCVDSLEKLIVEHKPKLVYLIPTFGNPSGKTLSLDRRKRVVELALQYRTLVVEDDPYGDLYFGATEPPSSILSLSQDVSGSRPYIAHCGSLSKILSPGLRIGWLIGPDALVDRAVMCKQFSDAHTSTFAQATAEQYLASGRMAGALASVRRVYEQRARAMGDALVRDLGDAISFDEPSGGLFIWARLTGRNGAPSDSNAFAKRAIKHKVAFVPGAPFYAREPDLSTLRLSFATSDVDRIQMGVSRLAQAL